MTTKKTAEQLVDDFEESVESYQVGDDESRVHRAAARAELLAAIENPKIPAAFACIECEREGVGSDEDGCCTTCGGDLFVLSGLPAEREHQMESIVEIVKCRAIGDRSAVIEECAFLADCEALKHENEADKHERGSTKDEYLAAVSACEKVADDIRALATASPKPVTELPQEVEEAIEYFADMAGEPEFNDNVPVHERDQKKRYDERRAKAKAELDAAILRFANDRSRS